MRTDLSYVNYGVAPAAWEWIQQKNREQMRANPICEICKRNKSDRITPLGKPLAACVDCIEDIYKQVEESSLYYNDEY
jgi:hypothetical protein